MDNNIEKKRDEDLRKLFAGSKIQAGEDLKYRIMQQVETESVFVKKRAEVKSSVPVVKNVLTVFGVMYGLILLVAAVAWFYGGKEMLLSLTFLVPVSCIAVICAAFALISVFDDHRCAMRRKDDARQAVAQTR